MKVILAAALAGVAAAALAWGLLIGSTDTTGTCHAPCVVTFDAPMAEDELKLDYRPGGTVSVWRGSPD